ncbi:hypothetical protein MKX70_12445 [Paenibacillus sp. FSL R7-0312]|uniref:hypothetical protein n=1 Tax=Paenibacillus sp. FSL R7-0312 TaxID=2921682 RepID=UPI0030FA780E
MKSFIKNFSYTLVSNFVSLLVSTLVILIVPKLIGLGEYGYWQLFIFYSAYVGFLHFGWNDGIYLRYGGKEYKDLDKRKFFSQFYMLIILQLLIATVVLIFTKYFISDSNRIFIICMTVLCMIIVNVRYMLLYILQSTNRIKEYAKITIADRILYSILILSFLLVGIREYQLLVIADLIGKGLSLVYAMYICKDIVFRKISSFYFDFKEVLENTSVGIKLMFANIASMLIIGIIRVGIERTWDVSTFGKISLTLNVCNLIMIFINAVGIIMFPLLRRTDEEKLANIYITIKDILIIVLWGTLIAYYPLKFILSAWLPKYSDSLVYMALVFPMCVYEGKMALLINTFLKTMRKEKLILKINLISFGLSLIFTLITTSILNNLNLAILSIVIILAFRCILSEIYISRILMVPVYKDVILELIMVSVFMVVGWFINSFFGVLIYLSAYLIYLFIKRKDIFETFRNVRLIISSKDITQMENVRITRSIL